MPSFCHMCSCIARLPLPIFFYQASPHTTAPTSTQYDKQSSPTHDIHHGRDGDNSSTLPPLRQMRAKAWHHRLQDHRRRSNRALMLVCEDDRDVSDGSSILEAPQSPTRTDHESRTAAMQSARHRSCSSRLRQRRICTSECPPCADGRDLIVRSTRA